MGSGAELLEKVGLCFCCTHSSSYSGCQPTHDDRERKSLRNNLDDALSSVCPLAVLMFDGCVLFSEKGSAKCMFIYIPY